jgi:hypothetical protein
MKNQNSLTARISLTFNRGSPAGKPVAFIPTFPRATASLERTRGMGGNRSTGRKYRSASRADPTSSRGVRAPGVLSWNQ